MAKTATTMRVEFTATLTLTEVECRALDALVCYGDDAFIKAFKEKLGEAYLRNHERGLKSAFEAIRRDVLPAIRDIEQARTDLGEAMKKRRAESSQ